MTPLDWANFSASVVTAVGLPVGVGSFVYRKRREERATADAAVDAQRRHDDLAFDELSRDWTDYLKLQLEHPELDLGEIALDDPPELDQLQRARAAALFNVFVAMCERAYLLYSRASNRALVAQWRGWEEYIGNQLERPNFAQLWQAHSEEYDERFVQVVERRLQMRRRVREGTVTAVRVGPGDGSTVALVVAAGSDPAAVLNTYMPAGVDEQGARSWLAAVGPHVFRVDVDGEPVGLLAAHAPRSPGVPDGYLETSTYLDPVARGCGVATLAWDSIEPQLADSCVGLAGVVWERNTAATSRLRRAGFALTDRVYYSEPGAESGWCGVWTKSLTSAGRPRGAGVDSAT